MQVRKNVVILGSINVDIILKLTRLPKPGETMKIQGLETAGGGKGANQAIAAARSNANVHFIGRVGDDQYGKMMCELMQKNGIDIEHIKADKDNPTGQAYILLQDSGENSILVNSGANASIQEEDVENARHLIESADVVVAQFEVPINRIIEAFKIAQAAGVSTILNPAPATKVSDKLLELTDLITPNEVEAEMLTGIHVDSLKAQRKSANKLQSKGARNVILTLGSEGAYYLTEDNQEEAVSALKVKAIDTTGAGDTFIGCLAAKLSPNFDNIAQAVHYANKASSLTVQKIGAIPSIPAEKEVLKR
ncbi:ribokinase [Liquorilactobacillus aquaticus DSM 21051]|uniref:Ribokinase n=1 Tax=Liquorilactobacillus aquaticus DSM 21051 TaxID=1423725 RepID=A0A0R2CUS2_9LACO|nr:ribokinase [Liquorilactobacillus aquaticus]KRM95585.1 ribokinase [Liquorilactobacillus aquaticus DSM 21051]